MLRILIADDEYLAVDALKMIVEKYYADGVVVGSASSGKDAILKASELNPDIILIDIHMPGIDGIEAIKQIRKTNQDVLFVILTAYDFFDYAKEAVTLNVLDYLLKPVNKDKLIQALQKAQEALNQRKDSTQKEIELREKIHLISPILENQFITQHLYSLGNFYSQSFYEKVFEMHLDKGYGISLMLTDTSVTDLKASLEIQSFFETSRIMFKKMGPCIVGQSVANKQFIVFPIEATEDYHSIKNNSIALISRVVKKLKGQYPLSFKIGIGMVHPYDAFGRSLNESDLALGFETGEDFAHYSDGKVVEPGSDVFYDNLINRFASSISNYNFEIAISSFRQIHEVSLDLDFEVYRIRIIELLLTIEKNLPMSRKVSRIDIVKELLELETSVDMGLRFALFLGELEKQSKETKSDYENGIIPEAMKFVETHYNEDISMDEVAKQVNVSYHYFSKIFKSQMGKSFTDYLTDLRIEKSMKMLQTTPLSIKEISSEIGYNDPNYYCKIFKKVTGVTPTEFRLTQDRKGPR